MRLLLPLLLGLAGCATTTYETKVLSEVQGRIWLRVDKRFQDNLLSFGVYRCMDDNGKVRCIKAEFVDNNGRPIAPLSEH